MKQELTVQNRQRRHRIDTALIRRIAHSLLQDRFHTRDYELGIHFISTARMAAMNQHHLGHEGATDIITFDYRDSPHPDSFEGELFICPEVAELQSREFGTSLQQELIRYVIHGLLHLAGFDDLEASDRIQMKAEEDRLVARTLDSWSTELPGE